MKSIGLTEGQKSADNKNRDALIEGAKKAACVATNAAMFFYAPAWVFGDESWFPADPVWVHITITMLCELDTMDRLNEKILLRTAGTTIGALGGCIMTFAGLHDPVRLLIILVWVGALGFIEKLNPATSYTWTIGTVTFGICTFLGRKGMYMTPWKRWFSIVLGTLVTCFWQLLLPYLGVLPKKIVRDELGKCAKTVWNGSVAMLEDAIQNPGDAEAGKRLSEKQVSIHSNLSSWPAAWKQYKFARNWMNLQPKKALPMDGLQALLKGPLFEVYLSSSAAARVLHRTGQSPVKDTYGTLRIQVHTIGLSVAAVVPVIATKDASEEVRRLGMKDLAEALGAAEVAKKQLGEMPQVHQALLAAVLLDTVKVILHLKGLLADVEGAASVAARGDKLLTDLSHIEATAGK